MTKEVWAMNKLIPVLIVCDDPASHRLLEDLLRSKGFELLSVKTAQEASEAVIRQKIPVAVVDLPEEEMSGIEALRRIKESSADTDCILLTESTFGQSPISAIDLGVYSYFYKPYDSKQLLMTICRIAENRQMESALRSSETRYRELVQNANSAIIRWKSDGTITFFNEYAQAFFGYSAEEAIGSHVNILVPETDSNGNDQSALVKDIVNHPDQYVNNVTENVCRDGRRVWMAWTNRPVPDHKGQVGEILAVGSDITPLKKIDEQLIKAREDWEKIFHAIGHFALILDGAQRVLAVNKTGLEIIGLPENEIVGRYCYEVFHKASSPPHGCPFLKMKDRPAGQTSEMLVEVLDRTFLVSCTALADASGKFEKAIHIATDVTDRKRSEEALKESEEKYRNLFEAESDALLLIERETENILDVNQAAVNLYGYSRNELLSMTIADLLSKSEQLNNLSENRELLSPFPFFSKKNGTVFPAEVKISAFRWKDQSVRIVSIRDITQKKVAELERQKLEEQLLQAQKMEAVGRLAGGIAHDFNNLLSVIMGYGELVLDDLHEGHPHYEQVNQIIEAGMRAQYLTRQLLAFSRKQVLEMNVVDINGVVTGFEKLMRRVIGEDIELRLSLATQEISVKADTSQLEQVLMNLAVNARDAMLDGGLLTIETRITEVDEYLAKQKPGMTPGLYAMISMSDTGCGMERKTQESIFEPFFTTKEEEKGTGLGLATSYGIIRQHHGGIWVYSELGQGTTFKIYLPLCMEGPDKGKEREELHEPIAGSATVLIVEDDPMVRKLTSSILESNGYRVIAADKVDDAVHRAQQVEGSIHLVLTDVIMPGMKGPELFARIAENNPKAKVLYMSGYAEEAITRHGVLQEGIQFIQKPFTLHGLLEKVAAVLNQ